MNADIVYGYILYLKHAFGLSFVYFSSAAVLVLLVKNDEINCVFCR